MVDQEDGEVLGRDQQVIWIVNKVWGLSMMEHSLTMMVGLSFLNGILGQNHWRFSWEVDSVVLARRLEL